MDQLKYEAYNYGLIVTTYFFIELFRMQIYRENRKELLEEQIKSTELKERFKM